MIINTGQRSDIPTFYPKWLANRLKEGFVYVRNPYVSRLVTKYSLSPAVVDCIGFCSKNPEPFLPYLDLLKPYKGIFFYVTITPYGKDIEPGVADKHKVIKAFQKISTTFGAKSMGWRYDPIFVSEKYSIEQHIKSFTKMAALLKGYTNICTISFIEFYAKVKRNFPEARPVTSEEKRTLVSALSKIANENEMRLVVCHDKEDFSSFGASSSGCMTQGMYEDAIGERLLPPPGTMNARNGCSCMLGGDIGAYDSCLHFCKYCYANQNRDNVLKNYPQHDDDSPLLIGHLEPGDIVKEAKQESWIDPQTALF